MIAGVVLAAVLSAAPVQVIIFAGGVTEADAQAAFASFKKLEPLLANVVSLPKGEPRIVESSTLPGLKPGFRVVTLGTCAAPEPVLSALKAIYPGTYARPLTGDVGLEKCPELSKTRVAAIDPPVKVGKLTINAFITTETEDDGRGREVSSGTLGFSLVEKSTGLVKAIAVADGGGDSQSGDGPAGWEYQVCKAVVTAEKAGFLITRECEDEKTGCDLKQKFIPKSWIETQRVMLKGEALVVGKVKREVTKQDECMAGADYGD